MKATAVALAREVIQVRVVSLCLQLVSLRLLCVSEVVCGVSLCLKLVSASD